MAPGFSALARADPSSANPLGESLLRGNYRALIRSPPRVLAISTPSIVNITNRARLRVSNESLGARHSSHRTACIAARDPYDVLDVNENSSGLDIKKAYHIAQVSTERKYREINEAYEVLKNGQNHSGNCQVEAGPDSFSASDVAPVVSSTIIEGEGGPDWGVFDAMYAWVCEALAFIAVVNLFVVAAAFNFLFVSTILHFFWQKLKF